jgi:hypothetical protein
MTRVRVKGFKIFADRHGRMRCYHRATGTAIDLEKAPIGSAEFFAACARVSALVVMAAPAKPGTLHLLIAAETMRSAIANHRSNTSSNPAKWTQEGFA